MQFLMRQLPNSVTANAFHPSENEAASLDECGTLITHLARERKLAIVKKIGGARRLIVQSGARLHE